MAATPGMVRADGPLDFVQVDHTQVDLFVVDEDGREPIGSATSLSAFDPALGDSIAPTFGGTTPADVDRACRLAYAVYDSYSRTDSDLRARFLEAIATNLLTLGDELVARTMTETGLSKARIHGELARTAAQVTEWARGFVRGQETDPLALPKDLVAGSAEGISYQSREEEGTQSPQQTLARGWGSCRDFAVLSVEASRSLGFGARIISGYLHNLERTSTEASEAGSTHAWAEIFPSGAGWITFDPTNHSVGGFNLIPVAVGRVITQVMPVTGTFRGMT